MFDLRMSFMFMINVFFNVFIHFSNLMEFAEI